MKKIFGWLLFLLSGLGYFILWAKAFKFLEKEIGFFWAFVIIIFTNVVGPGIYVVWNWIQYSFPTYYFTAWIMISIISIVGRVMINSAKMDSY